MNGKEGKRYGERNKEYRDEKYAAGRSAGLKGRKQPQTPR